MSPLAAASASIAATRYYAAPKAGAAIPTQIRGTAVGASFTFGLGAASLAPVIMGWIATASSVAAGLPLLALSFLMLAPLFVWFAPDMTRKELTDFVGQKAA